MIFQPFVWNSRISEIIMRKFYLLAMSLITMGGCSTNSEIPAPSEDYYVSVVKELSSEKYYGRSNYNNGTIIKVQTCR